MNSIDQQISEHIAQALQLPLLSIRKVIELLDDGHQLPFIARYRKEATGGLDDQQLRQLIKKIEQGRALAERRSRILKAIELQGLLTEALRHQIEQAETPQMLDDLYAPYRTQRSSAWKKALDAGLKPLAEQLWHQPELDRFACAQPFCSQAPFLEPEQALEGALQLKIADVSQDADLLAKLRRIVQPQVQLRTSQRRATSANSAVPAELAEKFRDYWDYSEQFERIPAHRALALFRGVDLGVLRLAIVFEPELTPTEQTRHCVALIARHYQIELDCPDWAWHQQVIEQAWLKKIRRHMESTYLRDLKEKAQQQAIDVFAENVQARLMSAPAGGHITLGLDPGFRSGCKVAVVNAMGDVLETGVIYPHSPQKRWQKSKQKLASWLAKHQVALIAIGDGTASRESQALIDELLAEAPQGTPTVQAVLVSEAGASVYSASELAAAELADLDVSLRGAVSIARRLQDPLAECVKIDPKAIGVGQYQHDVDQKQLAERLHAVVEDCVHAVGVDLNTASVALLQKVAGIEARLAQNIVDYRTEHGPFLSRAQLKKVPRLGPKAFEQCAGFLRITDAAQPLDGSAVHPEAYGVVLAIAKQQGCSLKELMNDPERLHSLVPENYQTEQFGEPTIRDILQELEKPGRDPRPQWHHQKFTEGVVCFDDVQLDMILPGVVSNVVDFGAFVDIGIHQDGLVHISKLADQFVADPHQFVRVGDQVRVRVCELDHQRQRVSLSMRDLP